MKALRAVLADDAGGTTVQYAIVSAVFAAVMIGALSALAAECASRLGVTGAKMPALGTSPA